MDPTDRTEPEGEAQPFAVDPEELRQRARHLLEAQRAQEALDVLQAVTDRDPEDAEAWCLVAEAFYHLEDADQALRAAELAIQAETGGAGGHLWKCRCLLRQMRNNEASAAAQQARELVPSNWDIRCMLVRSLVAAGRVPEAEVEWAAVRAECPADPRTAYLLGEILRTQGKLSAAAEAFASAIESDTSYAEAWAGMGQVHKAEERHRQAAECFCQASLSAPSEVEYRHEFVWSVDRSVPRLGESLLVICFGGTVFLSGLWMASFFPPILLLAFWVLVRGISAIERATLRRVVARISPRAQEHYWAAKARQDVEDAANNRRSRNSTFVTCGFLVMVLALFQFLRWESVLQILLVVGLTGLWVRGRFQGTRREQAGKSQFRFPTEFARAAIMPDGSESTDPHDVAWAYFYTRDAPAARTIASRILADHPEDLAALKIYSLALLVAGDFHAGLVAAERMVSLDRQGAEATAILWLQLAASGSSDEVATRADEAPEATGDVLTALTELVATLFTGGWKEAARVGVELVERIAPDSAQASAVRAERAASELRWTEAEAGYRNALALEPGSAFYLSGLGLSVVAQRRHREAWRYWNECLRLDPECRRARHYLEGEIKSAGLIVSMVLGAAIGGVALWPTLAGAPRNDWMPWATFAGPLALSLPGSLIRRLLKALIAPGLSTAGRSAEEGWIAAAVPSVLVSFPVLLLFHTIQAWIEVARHPGLIDVRWQGAATITFLAVYVALAIRRILKSRDASADRG